MRSALYLLVLACALFSCAQAVSADGDLPREKLVEMGKAATAMVEVTKFHGRAYATAFCINSAGVFVTNAHVMEGALQSECIVVVNPALKTQRKLKGRLFRLDKPDDLAILCAQGASDLPALALGSMDGLTVTDEIIAFGFPFGKLLSENESDPPAVGDHVGNVTSLTRRQIVGQRIQFDAALNPGNSGGPLLNRKGQVVGVVEAGISGAQVNSAIPITILSAILRRPLVDFGPPAVDGAAMSKPVVFEARAYHIRPSKKALVMELTLENGDSAPRRFPMELKQGVYQAAAVPLPSVAGGASVKVVVECEQGTFSDTVPDRTVKLVGKEFKLSELQSIRWKAKPETVTADGTTYSAVPTGLDAIDLSLGKSTIHIVLSDAIRMTVSLPKVFGVVKFTVSAKEDGVEFARIFGFLGSEAPPAAVAPSSASSKSAALPPRPVTVAPIVPPSPPAAVPPSSTSTKSAALPPRPVTIAPIVPPSLDRDKIVRPLPGAIADLCMGGGGRYIIMRLSGQQQLAVFDVQAAKVVKQIPLAEENVQIAAGAERLVVIFPEAKLIHLWNLKSLQRERSALLPENISSHTIHQICMGSASAGPIFVYLSDEKRTVMLDLDTLAATDVHWTNWAPNNAYGPMEMRVSPDGSMLIGWGGGWAGSEVAFFNQGKQSGSNPNVRCGLAFALPSADSRYIFVSGGMQARTLAMTEIPALSGAYIVPATEPGYFVDLAKMTGWAHVGDKLDSGQISIYNYDRRMLFSLSKLDELKVASPLPWEKRIHYYPLAGMLVTVGAEQDRFIVRRVNLVEELDRSGADYLVVLSQPPLAKAGSPFSYKLDIRSKAGGVKVSLESGPDGLAVSPEGQVTWNVPSHGGVRESNVIVALRDASGQEVFHTFAVRVADNE